MRQRSGPHLTDRRKAGEAAQLLSFIEQAPLAIAMFDREMRYLAASRLWVAAYGKGLSDLVGRSHYELHPDIPERWKEVHRRALAGERLHDDEDLWIQADGTRHWLRWAVLPWYDARSEIGGIIMSGEDITARKLAEEALRERERMLSESQRIAHVGSWILDLDGRVTWSDETYRVYGLSPGKSTPSGESFPSLIHPEDRPAMEAWVAACKGGEKPGELQFRVVWPDASVHVLSGLGELKKSAEGRPMQMAGTVQDITERKRAEEALREAGERLSLVIEGTKTGLWDWDLRTDEVCYSKEWKNLLGYEEREVGDDLGEWRRLAHPDDVEPTLARVRGFLQGSLSAFESEFRMRHKSGEYRWILSRATKVLGDDGKVARLLGMHIDITERKQAEKALLERHAELLNLYATTPAGLALIDRDLRFVRINERLAAINGKSVEEHIGRMVEEVLPDLARHLTDIYRRILETGEPVLDVEIHGTAPAEPGIERDWLASYCPVRDADGAVCGISVAVLEVTERRRAEAALRESERRYRTVVTQSPIGIFETDPGGGCTFVNRRWSEISGLSPEEAMGDGWVKAIHADDRAGVFAAWERATASGVRFDQEYRFCTPRGDVTWVRGIAGAARDERGEVVGYLGTVNDITGRKRAEVDLSRARTMAALGAVVAGVAHEIRNPLFAMTSTLDALEERLAGARAPHLAVLHRELERLGRLTSDLLDYGRETGLELRPVSIGEVLSAAALESERSGGGRDVRVEMAAPGDLPALQADRERLQQVFRNVIDNALHHSPPKEAVHVVARLATDEEGDLIECTVADGGPGFTPEGLEHAFEPFFSRRKGGTGLGLSIARRLVEAHGGIIAVGNRPEGGAIVTVRLPVAGPR